MYPVQKSIIPTNMPSWTDFLNDEMPIKAIYGSDTPSLKRVNMHEIVLNRDGPAVLLRFDFQDFPSKPPQKWVKAGFDRVQARLLATGVSGLTIAGLKSCMDMDLSISKEAGLIRIVGAGDDIEFHLTAEFLLVQSINAYVEGG
ncbi:MAG: immunity 50 family protein [Hydrogenophaga sp.]|jgi:hypothetical protein|nr:immunity 50 family protein [Hydrogenophaga sp.]